jgi:hypothetical protein
MSKETKDLAKANAVGKGGEGGNLKDAGYKTGLDGANTYGADLSGNATNSLGKFKANSQPADETCPGEKC